MGPESFSKSEGKHLNFIDLSKELGGLRKLTARDPADATVAGVSADRIFATPHNAILQLSELALAYASPRGLSAMPSNTTRVIPTECGPSPARSSY